MESKFQFTNPSLMSLEFGINEDFCKKDDEEVNIGINMSVAVEEYGDKNETRVSLTFELGQKNENSPFFINAVEIANFRWDAQMDSEMVDKLLNQNAPSLLLSYLRPVVTQITAASQFNAFNIPFMNFTKQK